MRNEDVILLGDKFVLFASFQGFYRMSSLMKQKVVVRAWETWAFSSGYLFPPEVQNVTLSGLKNRLSESRDWQK
ncbi:hypothetical protein NQ315_008558 [Exocentrus adspersus]|uniref:Uncharacterized protein n=1 Tax=Exocentrus adspersus TaxID=1586481 RepID=A0AAV8W628_9CUCU|nr:hypothetical protein NQ315_008558 [Exocentrus adspersus]